MARQFTLKRRPKGRFRRRILGLAVLAGLIAWAGGPVGFLDRIPRTAEMPPDGIDAAVVLTGGSQRLIAAADLVESGAVSTVFVSGVGATVDKAAMVSVIRDGGGKLSERTADCCLELGHTAQDTIGNARETAAWAQEHAVGSLVVVTSNYHMPRALLELQARMPDVGLVPYAVQPAEVRLDDLIRSPGTLRLIAVEYTKYLAATARIRLSNALRAG